MCAGIIKRIEDAVDLGECLNVLNTAYKHRDEKLGIDRSYKRADVSYEELKEAFDNGTHMYGYYSAGRLAALLSFKEKGDNVKLKDIVVLPEYQGKGIGSLLMDHLKSSAENEGKERIILGFLYNISEYYIVSLG